MTAATERQLNPTRSLFEENRDSIAPVIKENLPERGFLSGQFGVQVGYGINPLEPNIEMPSLADNSNILSEEERLHREVIANSTIQVSENLTNAPTLGLKCEEPKQSDIAYGTCSLFSLTGEALGLKPSEPEEFDMPETRLANAFDFRNTWSGPRAPMA